MRFLSAALLSVLLTTTACAPVGLLAGAGATVGTAAAREGGISQSVEDRRIEMYIHDAWFRYSTTMLSKLNVTSTEGRVLLTGIVQDQQLRLDAVRLAWQAPGVKQIINEIKLQNGEGFSGYSRDKWIATQFRSKLIFDKEIESINYSAETVGGVIYLMGVAQNQAELARVISYARSIKYVRDVVSYVRVMNSGGGYNSQANTAPVPNNNYNTNATSSSYNDTYNNNAPATSSVAPANATANYDYQPETRRAGNAAVESSDLGPVR